MDSSRNFFSKLRTVAVSLEKELKQLEQALHGENTEHKDVPPMKVLSDLRREVSSLKEAFNASLHKSCSRIQAINKFMKASEILMKRNEEDLEEIRKLFQKNGYKTCVKDSTGNEQEEEEEEEVKSDSTASVQNKSDEDKTDDAPDLPAGTEKSLVPADPLRNPRLSDFGLSQYSFYRPWGAVEGQHATNVHQANLNRTPLKPLTPCTLPKTPKCKLKMDDYECVTPKLEHFGISEHTMCMNEDYTMSLMHKTAQTSEKLVKDDHEVTVQDMTPRKIMVTPGSKSKVTTDNANWMASPMMPVFCTPDVKTPYRSNSTVLSRLPETNEQPLPSHTGTPQCPDFETRWIKEEAKFLNSNSEGKTELVTKNDETDKQHEDSISFAESSEYLKHFRDPSPPKIKDYDQLLNTPPPPEITKIPDDVLQILCKYSGKVDSNTKEMETETRNATKYESDVTDYCNKENRGYPELFKPNI
ncbi:spindle and kinetochore-associated protein 3 isoform X2 [Neopsephotus bourkii]|uniref:spindle and kinetochore-associated protein 3 isoform X2 n=1 Tax=Neopsephotus bourkii TaxID=309878 RepID=UPI002AA53EC6|nr:spindle and kinetochore-associated protein 3 isoform X2 [Neopsephotus bourkii]